MSALTCVFVFGSVDSPVKQTEKGLVPTACGDHSRNGEPTVKEVGKFMFLVSQWQSSPSCSAMSEGAVGINSWPTASQGDPHSCLSSSAAVCSAPPQQRESAQPF